MLDYIDWRVCYLQTGLNEYTGLVDQYLKLIGNSPSRNLRPRECTPVVDQRSKEAPHAFVFARSRRVTGRLLQCIAEDDLM